MMSGWVQVVGSLVVGLLGVAFGFWGARKKVSVDEESLEDRRAAEVNDNIWRLLSERDAKIKDAQARIAVLEAQVAEHGILMERERTGHATVIEQKDATIGRMAQTILDRDARIKELEGTK